MIRVLGIGDSIMRGNVAGGGTGFFEILEAAFPELECDNQAVGGSSSQSWSPKYDFLASPAPGFKSVLDVDQGHEVVLIGLGGNDALGGGQQGWVPNTGLEYHLAMTDIVETLLARRDRIIIITAPVEQPAHKPPSTFNARIRDNRAWSHKPWWPLFTVRYARPVLTEEHYDGMNVHPNQLGHQEIADTIEPVLGKAVYDIGVTTGA